MGNCPASMEAISRRLLCTPSRLVFSGSPFPEWLVCCRTRPESVPPLRERTPSPFRRGKNAGRSVLWRETRVTRSGVDRGPGFLRCGSRDRTEPDGPTAPGTGAPRDEACPGHPSHRAPSSTAEAPSLRGSAPLSPAVPQHRWWPGSPPRPPRSRATRCRDAADWTTYRHQRWSASSNPHLLVSQKTAADPDHPPISIGTLSGALPRGLTPGGLRQDRILDEAAESADPLRLMRLFGITEQTAMRYVGATHPERTARLPR